jgi:hypothetical protein
MISVLATTGKYILQPSLMDRHRKSLEWLSTTVLWKRELWFFQKLLTDYSQRFTSETDKKKISHFQSLVTYYGGEVVDVLRKKIREHETNLAHMLQSEDEADTQYFKEHNAVMDELETFNTAFITLKHDLYEFIERVM